MSEQKKYGPVRIAMMLIGILLIGMCVASYRMSGFGVDPFSCMNLGISGFLGMSFGNWQLIVNVVLLIIVWFTVRHCIGLGTIVNMVFVGYTADFLCWLFLDQFGLHVTIVPSPMQLRTVNHTTTSRAAFTISCQVPKDMPTNPLTPRFIQEKGSTPNPLIR